MKTILPVSSRLSNATKATGILFMLVFAFLFGFSNSAKAQASQTITFHTLAAKTYGAADFSPGATASSGLPVSYVSSNLAVATIVSGNIHIVGAGTAAITASQAGNGSFKAATPVSQQLTVNTAALTVTATTVNKTYGTALADGPSTGFTTSALKNGETVSSVTITYSSGALATDGIGDYLLCVIPSAATGSGTFNANNYNITYVSSDINVAAANLTITADSVIKPYGTALTGGPGSQAFTAVGLQNGETIGSVTISYSSGALATDDIGDYIQCVGISSDTLGTFDPNNYNVTLVNNNIDVVPAVLTISGISISDKGFDGTTSAVIVGSPVLNGVMNGDAITLVTDTAVAVFNSPAAGSNVPVTVSGYDISGANTFDYALTQPTGLTANIIGNSDASLSNLIPNTGALSPAFASGTFAYTESVSNSVSSITLTPMTTDTNATVTVNGVAVARGAASGAIALNVGSNMITTLVTAQDGTTTQSYALNVTRAAASGSGVALSAIALSSGSLSPAFSASTLTYNVAVGNGITTFKVTPFDKITGATITVNGTTVASGTASAAIPLSVGANTVTIIITATGGSSTYTLTVTRAVSSNANLSAFKISKGTLAPVFAAGTINYTASVANGLASMTVTPTVADATATITVNGLAVASGSASQSLPLVVGPDTIKTVVTAQDGVTKKTYTLVVTEAASTNANLSGLTPSTGKLSPVFTASVTSYNESVPSTVSTITITPTTTVTTSTVKVNGTTVASGTPSSPIALAIGANNIAVVVTAQDGSTTKTYNITVTRTLSTNANLSAFKISKGTLAPVFAAATTSYTASVANGVASITVTPTVADTTATITVNSLAVASGSASQSLPLVVGPNTITTVVTAQDGVTKKTYTLVVTEAASTVATLSGLKTGTGTLAPAFTPSATSYTESVANSVSTITVTPTTTNATETVKVNGTTVASGTASGAIALNLGANTINTVVTAQDGSTTKTYTITVTRAAVSSNAGLSALKLSVGALSPVFATATTSYSATENFAASSITVTPTTADAGATVKVNGTSVTSGTASGAITLAQGANSITVIVTAQDGSTTKTYTVAVTRSAPLKNAQLTALALSSGTLNPAFAATTIAYAASVANSVASITVTPTTADVNATVTVNGTTVISGTASGSLPLVVGSNTITVAVTAQDGATKKTYTITVTKAPSSNDNLAGLTLSNGTLAPVFATGTTSYTANVGNGLASMTVTPTTADPTATITVNGTAVTSGSPSQSLPLVVGANTINVVVTAQDGSTTQTYSVVVTEAKSTNDNLLALKPTPGPFSPTFTANTTSYTESVANSVSSMTLTPTTVVSTATVTVNGTAVTSGTASGPIALAVGSNTITTVVTAQSGATKTYTLTVTRAAGGADSFVSGISVSKPNEAPALAEDGLVVHQGLSPNGDGVNDFLQIDNIAQYPQNKISIMNRNGQLVYEANGYDNSSKVFDGHSNKNGQMQLPGTYFYQLDYVVGGITKHKTGFLVLKY